MATKKKAKKRVSTAGGFMKVASRNASYKKAKVAAKKAAARQKAAWKKAVTAAKKQIKKRR